MHADEMAVLSQWRPDSSRIVERRFSSTRVYGGLRSVSTGSEASPVEERFRASCGSPEGLPYGRRSHHSV